MLFDWVIPMSLNQGSLWCGTKIRMKRDWRSHLRSVRWLKASGWMEVSLLEYMGHERLNVQVWMWNDDWVWGQDWSDCWVHWTHPKGGRSVGWNTRFNERWLKEGCLWNEWKEQIGEAVESIEHIRIEGGDRVGVKFNERGNWLMKVGKTNSNLFEEKSGWTDKEEWEKKVWKIKRKEK